MPIDPKKCCGTHSKEKEESGTCCQQNKTEQQSDKNETKEEKHE